MEPLIWTTKIIYGEEHATIYIYIYIFYIYIYIYFKRREAHTRGGNS